MYEMTLTVIIQAIEFVAAAMIVIAVVLAVWRLLLSVLRRSEHQLTAADVRLQIGQQLVLALEVLIAADILKTVLAPTLEDLAFLGGIILIRTVLSLSIAYELHRSTASMSHPKDADAKEESSSRK